MQSIHKICIIQFGKQEIGLALYAYLLYNYAIVLTSQCLQWVVHLLFDLVGGKFND